MQPLRFLMSYWYFKNKDLNALFARDFATDGYPEFFADSGGFSALTQGAVIKLDDYTRWLDKHKSLITVYANLDSIGNPAKTRENQHELELMGFDPVPVFHVGSEWKYLDEMVEQYPYIALGGMVRFSRQRGVLFSWLKECFARGRGAAFHGFGITGWPTLRQFPFYSVDSSAWSMGYIRGRLSLFDDTRGKMHSVYIASRNDCYRHIQWFVENGFNVEDYAKRDNNNRAKNGLLSAVSFRKAEKWLQRKHGEIALPGHTPGLKLYLADTDYGNMSNAYRGLMERKQYGFEV